jgi:hypothetical protein
MRMCVYPLSRYTMQPTVAVKTGFVIGASSLSGTQQTAVDSAILLWNPDGVCDRLEKRCVRIPILFTIKRNDSEKGRCGDFSILQSFPSLNREAG